MPPPTAASVARAERPRETLSVARDARRPVRCAPARGATVAPLTRWLLVRGNVIPGEELTLRLAIWDVGDAILDSTALLDAFHWELNPVVPGTE